MPRMDMPLMHSQKHTVLLFSAGLVSDVSGVKRLLMTHIAQKLQNGSFDRWFEYNRAAKAQSQDSEVTALRRLEIFGSKFIGRMKSILTRVDPFDSLGKPRNAVGNRTLRQIGRLKRFVAIEPTARPALDLEAIRRKRRLPRFDQFAFAVAMIEGMGMIVCHYPSCPSFLC